MVLLPARPDEIGLPSDRYSVPFTGHNKVTVRLFPVFMSNWGAVHGIGP